jgi:hypothetical protein
MTEITDDERIRRASNIFTDAPCIWLFSFVEMLADELGLERDGLLTTTLRMWHKWEKKANDL